MPSWNLKSVAHSGPLRTGGFSVAGGTVCWLCHPRPADHGLLCHAPQGTALASPTDGHVSNSQVGIASPARSSGPVVSSLPS